MNWNWKTSLGGVAAVATGVTLIVNGNVTEGIAAIASGIGLWFAKDHNK